MLFTFYRFLSKSTTCPGFIHLYGHNVYDEDGDGRKKRQIRTHISLIVDDQAAATEQPRNGIESISLGVFDIVMMDDVQTI